MGGYSSKKKKKKHLILLVTRDIGCRLEVVVPFNKKKPLSLSLYRTVLSPETRCVK